MVKNVKILERFNREQIKNEDLSYEESLAIFNSLYEEAINLKVFSSQNIMEGFEAILEIAKTINSIP
ncbi:hypothetical protein JXI42_00890 [bacterium]|nr:hypothetical protein [bacterium]